MISSSRPYLIRAIYDWLVDNRLTPYVMVDAGVPDVKAPEQFIEDGKIVLNIAPQAVGSLSLGNDALEFEASFSGIVHHLHIPVKAVKAIYAFENGRGMVFHEDDDQPDSGDATPPKNDPPKGRPNLRIVK